MKLLEDNGYRNVTGFKKQFAIELEDYQSSTYSMGVTIVTGLTKNG